MVPNRKLFSRRGAVKRCLMVSAERSPASERLSIAEPTVSRTAAVEAIPAGAKIAHLISRAETLLVMKGTFETVVGTEVTGRRGTAITSESVSVRRWKVTPEPVFIMSGIAFARKISGWRMPPEVFALPKSASKVTGKTIEPAVTLSSVKVRWRMVTKATVESAAAESASASSTSAPMFFAAEAAAVVESVASSKGTVKAVSVGREASNVRRRPIAVEPPLTPIVKKVPSSSSAPASLVFVHASTAAATTKAGTGVEPASSPVELRRRARTSFETLVEMWRRVSPELDVRRAAVEVASAAVEVLLRVAEPGREAGRAGAEAARARTVIGRGVGK